MRAPISWLAEFAQLPAHLSPRDIGDALVRVGLEVERVESGSDALTGPIVVGRALSVDPEPQKNGKTINWCTVDVGEEAPRGIVCGAHNFQPGDLVVVALPGAVLPGGFSIAARKTYGHVSDGMICSVRELGIGEDHAGILVLPPGSAEPGQDAPDVLGLRDAVLDIAVTPDRGYCFSVRGLAREASIALGVAFTDVADTVVVPPIDGGAYPVEIEDVAGCDQFAARAISGVDPGAPTPDWMARRLRQAGMRPISLVVDVTNYVMLETGQPLHAFDRGRLSGPIGVRRARGGERLTTLDGVVRSLDPDDLVVTDETGPLALAGVMGGASTEITDTTTEVLFEAAHWNPASILRSVRRHKLPSEAGKRFERGVDPRIAGVALARCVELLVEHGRAQAVPGYTVVGTVEPAMAISLSDRLPSTLSGLEISRDQTIHRLEQVGCVVSEAGTGTDSEVGTDTRIDTAGRLQVTPPSWRPDLTDPADLVEEVLRIVGYEKIPSTLPTPPPGRGLTESQRLRRTVARAVAAAGYSEVLTYPFVAPGIHDAFGLAADDPRRSALVVVNPLSDAEPQLRTSLLPGLVSSLLRNQGRGQRDLAIFEVGLIYRGDTELPPVPHPGVAHRPSDPEYAALLASVPKQPRHLGAIAAGSREQNGWWGAGRGVDWADAIELARIVARQYRAGLTVRAGDFAPWHPGRCAELVLDGTVIGHAGELHPRVIANLDLPPRTVAMELDLSAFEVPPPVVTPSVSAYPPVLLDLALVVSSDTPSTAVLDALGEGAGPLLESVRLFDVYTDAAKLGPGLKSLAFSLRLRAPDRTLTSEDAASTRDAALARAAELTGARLRS
ncbi:MAG: pheT [Pseudonocardiales bacterium]|nr:pheT [Pseudonocardiales bacterium]